MWVALVIFFAAIVQSAMGFGMALVAMPILTLLLGVQVAAPAFALLSTTTSLLNAYRWRAHVTRRELVRLLLPALVGIPLGVWLLGNVDPAYVTGALGILLLLYAVTSLAGVKLPVLAARSNWAVAAGFSAGVLGGAYNTGGPPVVWYAVARQWTADQFRGTLQSFFFLAGLFVCLTHFAAGHVSTIVWQTALLAVPALLLGQFTGVRLTRYISQELFRRLVLVLLLGLGIALIVG